MERQELIELLDIVDVQVSSAILGGREADYEELEALGYVRIDREAAQWAATITPSGLAYLNDNR